MEEGRDHGESRRAESAEKMEAKTERETEADTKTEAENEAETGAESKTVKERDDEYTGQAMKAMFELARPLSYIQSALNKNAMYDVRVATAIRGAQVILIK